MTSNIILFIARCFRCARGLRSTAFSRQSTRCRCYRYSSPWLWAELSACREPRSRPPQQNCSFRNRRTECSNCRLKKELSSSEVSPAVSLVILTFVVMTSSTRRIFRSRRVWMSNPDCGCPNRESLSQKLRHRRADNLYCCDSATRDHRRVFPRSQSEKIKLKCFGKVEKLF